MSVFRLLSLDTLAVEEFALNDHPAYLAASHAWIDATFVPGPERFDDTFGGKGTRAVVDHAYHSIRHCWIDTLCIDQQDEQDKLTQIPLMSDIFSQAVAVVVFINAFIGAGQHDVDEVVDGLQGALAMCQADAWQEEGDFWQSGEGRVRIVKAMRGLQRLASTIWATRVWTLQEYVLARTVIWIGLDLTPIRFDDYVLAALPEICDTLNIQECLGSDMRAVSALFQGMASFRTGDIDRTRVMELLGNRNAKHRVDEVYGAMAASGIAIQPLARESPLSAWTRWCEAAITQGHVRWILLPQNGGPPSNGEEFNCVLPYFTNRHKLSASSGLDAVKPLSPVTIQEGSVTVSARKVGTVKILRRLGTVHEDFAGRTHRDITLIMFAQGKPKLALQIASAFGGGRYNSSQTKSIARVLTRSYLPALALVINGDEVNFRPSVRNASEQLVWDDFMQLQQSQMLGLNEGTGHLCRISSTSQDKKSNPTGVLTVFVGPETISNSTTLEVLDFSAKTADRRSVLMVVRQPAEGAGSAHKVGMTLPMSEDMSVEWVQLPLERVQLGGRACRICSETRDQASPRCRGVSPAADAGGRDDALEAVRTRAAAALRRRLTEPAGLGKHGSSPSTAGRKFVRRPRVKVLKRRLKFGRRPRTK